MEETGTGVSSAPMARAGDPMARTKCTPGGLSSPRVTAQAPMAEARAGPSSLRDMAEVRADTAVEATQARCRAEPLSPTLPTSPPRLRSSSTRPPTLPATPRRHRLTDMGKLSLEDTCPNNARNPPDCQELPELQRMVR